MNETDRTKIESAFEEQWELLEDIGWTRQMDKRTAKQWFHLAWRACEAQRSAGESRIVLEVSNG